MACGLGEQTCCCLFSVAAEHEKPHINSRIAMQCVAIGYMAMATYRKSSLRKHPNDEVATSAE